MQIVFPLSETALHTVHQCEVKQDGEWTVYTCKQCPHYEKKVHRPSGRVRVKGVEGRVIDHVPQSLK
jgi:hypothetical protein